MTPLLELMAGSRSAWVVALFWLGVLGGVARLARRDSSLAVFSSLLVAGQVAGIWYLSPVGIGNPTVFNRYVLVALPFVLLLASEGLAGLAAAASRIRLPVAAALPAVAVAALAVAGPLVDRARTWSSLLHTDPFLGFYVPRPRFVGGNAAPAFYRSAAAREGGGIVEYNGLPTWGTLDMLSLCQQAHQRPIWQAPTDGGLFPDGVDLAPLVRPNREAILGTPARWLVVHLDAEAEQMRIEWPGAFGTIGLKPALGEQARRAAARMVTRLVRAWGRPAIAGDGIAVWDLDAVRAQAGHRPRRHRRPWKRANRSDASTLSGSRPRVPEPSADF